MKLNKTIALMAILAGGLVTGLTLQAQDAPQNNPNPPGQRGGPGGPGGGMRGPNVDQMAKDLGLTDDQKNKIKAAMDERMQKAQELRKDTNLSQEDRRAKMQEIQKAFTDKMKEILTPEQFDKWQKNQPQRNRGGQRGGQGGTQKPATSADKPQQ